MYYAFFTDPDKQFAGEIELRGLMPGKYEALDYADDKDLGAVQAEDGKPVRMKTEFKGHLYGGSPEAVGKRYLKHRTGEALLSQFLTEGFGSTWTRRRKRSGSIAARKASRQVGPPYILMQETGVEAVARANGVYSDHLSRRADEASLRVGPSIPAARSRPRAEPSRKAFESRLPGRPCRPLCTLRVHSAGRRRRPAKHPSGPSHRSSGS